MVPFEDTDRQTATPVWWARVVMVNVAVLFVLSVMLRVWKLGNIPGMNGDEAQYGIYAIQWLRGEPIPLTTNTGNPLNIFFFIPQVVLHALFRPSFALIRSVAVFSGLAALAINFALARRLLGRTTAVASTLVLAVLPINIAYSRFGWDSSQSLAATLLVLYGSLGAAVDLRQRARWLMLAVAGGAAAVLVHPTNVFILPFVALAIAWPAQSRLLEWIDPRRMDRQRLIISAGMMGLALLSIAVFRRFAGIGSGGLPRWMDGVDFARNYLRLFSGVAVYRYIPGSQVETRGGIWPWGGDWGAFDLATGVLLIIAGLCGWRLARRGKYGSADWFLVAGWLLELLAFFLIAGPRAIAPHWERYGLCLIAPLVIMASHTMVNFLDRLEHRRRFSTGACLAVGWMVVIGFHSNYFAFIEHTGGRSHRAFRTAEKEPKAAVLEYVLSQTPADGVALIVSDDWWSYWPMRYLALEEPRLRVTRSAEAKKRRLSNVTLRNERVWFVQFVATGGCDAIRKQLLAQGHDVEQQTIRDFSGRPLLLIISPRNGPRLAQGS